MEPSLNPSGDAPSPSPIRSTARRASAGRHRRAKTSVLIRSRLVTALALTIRAQRLRAEDMRILLGESEGGAGSLRNEFAHIRARRTCIGVERLQVFCEALDIDAIEVIAGVWQPPVLETLQ